MTARLAFHILFQAAPIVYGLSLSTAASASEPNEDVDEIVVQATRLGRSQNAEAIRVDVINREEIEEKILMSPGNISTLVAETPGVRVQSTSAALGASNVRMQGMPGRYTQILSDGLPLYGGQASSIGLMQIPPTDLGQVEVIKGSASALYGASALGGVINLVSRRPKQEANFEFLGNVTSRGGQDITVYTDSPLNEALSLSLTGGYHRQNQQDLDDDGWIDMPAYERWTLRPRLFVETAGGATALITAGFMEEGRDGGTLKGGTTPDGQPFALRQDSQRLDIGLNVKLPLGDAGDLSVRASAMQQKQGRLFGDREERDRMQTGFVEAAFTHQEGSTQWLLGTAFQVDALKAPSFPIFDYQHRTISIFTQIEQEADPDFLLSGSARFDFHNEYGAQFSPRISALYHPNSWTFRASLARGFYGPTSFIDEIESTGLSQVQFNPDLKAETAMTASIDLGYAKGPFHAALTFFTSNIDDAVRLEEIATDRVQLINALGPARIRGGEAMLRYRWNSISLTGSYVLVDATERNQEGAYRVHAPRSPRHTAGLVAMWEEHDRGRIGLEAYYTGRQTLDDNPYRQKSRPYFELGALAEVVLGKARLFINAENILNVRQTKYDPILLPQRSASGSWTVDAWSPTEGFVVNGGVRLKFGRK